MYTHFCHLGRTEFNLKFLLLLPFQCLLPLFPMMVFIGRKAAWLLPPELPQCFMLVGIRIIGWKQFCKCTLSYSPSNCNPASACLRPLLWLTFGFFVSFFVLQMSFIIWNKRHCNIAFWNTDNFVSRLLLLFPDIDLTTWIKYSEHSNDTYFKI